MFDLGRVPKKLAFVHSDMIHDYVVMSKKSATDDA